MILRMAWFYTMIHFHILLCCGISQCESIFGVSDALSSSGRIYIVRDKRSLNWKTKPYRIVHVDEAHNIEIKSLKSHERNNLKISETNKAYIGFTLYKGGSHNDID